MTGLGLSVNGWGGKSWPLADELHPTAWVVSESRKVLAAMLVERPLFLTASFYAPHPPLFPPGKYFDRYMKATLPAPAHGDWVAWDGLSPAGDKQGRRVRLEGDARRATQAGYFGLIEHLDDQIEPLIADFKARSEKAGRSWVIVVTSDHAEMLGDHGFFRKCEPFEGSANIPLIVAASPGSGFKAGLRSMKPVCLEDIMPTLLELAGAKCPGGSMGSAWCQSCAEKTGRCANGCTPNMRRAIARNRHFTRSPTVIRNISGGHLMAPNACLIWITIPARSTISSGWRRGASCWSDGAPA
ncbi:MAG: sulfatase-like hydrolase/transferase [Verrucomicrobiota bacterium]